MCEGEMAARRITRLQPGVAAGGSAALSDPETRVLCRLGLRDHGHLLVRPDGHLSYPGEGTDLTGVLTWLATWLSRDPP
jgi:hypothetical protein